ncbi:unnamed protein product, partial [Schistocephalus solidus]|uniref:REJ domain-containing protein n=1 Tax=Schistocephalus solidus TaxID=70667 RepID=A0A183SJ07_SCHSO
EIAIQVEYKGPKTDLAAGVRVIVDWGDGGTPDVVSPQDFTSPFVLRHSMLRDNICLCQVLLENQISTVRQTFEIGYFKPLFAAALDVFIGDTNVQGYGKRNNRFTLNDRVRLTPVAMDGTIEKTHIIITHIETNIIVLNVTFREPFYLFEMTELGRYAVQVNMSNFLTSFQVRRYLIVDTLIRDLRVVLVSSSLIPKEDGLLAVQFLGLASYACICVSLGNGVNIIFRASEDAPKACVPCPNYMLVGTLPKASNQTTIRVQYPSPGQYRVQAVAHAGSQTVRADLSVPVFSEHCSLTRIHLQNPSYSNPNSPQWITTLDRTTVFTVSSGSTCERFGPLSFKWRLWRLAEKTAERTEEIEMQQQVGRTNFHIFLPPRFLRPGLYEVELTGWLERIRTVSHQVISGLSIFLAVEEAMLIIQFTEDNADVINLGTEDAHFCLAPANFSYDPNMETDSSKSVITNWTVTCQAQSLKKDDTKESELTLCPSPLISTGVFCLPTALFDHSQTYSFTATGSTNTQSGTDTISVKFVPGHTPQLKIKLALPALSMEGYHDTSTCVSPTNDLILNGECIGHCGTVPAFRWELHLLIHDEVLQEPRTLELPDAADDYTSLILIIKASALVKINRSEELRVCFVAVGLPSRPRVCRVFCLAAPPLLGECRINVTGPISPDTYVSISCEGTGNSGRPFIYRFYTKEDGGNFVFHTSSLPLFEGQLPHRTGEFTVCIRVIDNYCSYDERCFVQIEFQEPTLTQLYEGLRALANETDNRLTRVIAEGNFNEISVACQSLANAILQVTRMEGAGDKVLRQLSEAATAFDPMGVSSLLEATSNLVLVTQNSRDLPREGQNRIANYFDKIADHIVEYAQYMPPEDARNMGQKALRSAFSLLEAIPFSSMMGANSQFDSPVPFDIVTDFKDMDYDTDIDSEETLEADSDDQLEAWSMFETRKKQESVLRNIYGSLMKMQKSAALLLQPLLAPGGEQIEYISEAGRISVFKLKTESWRRGLEQSSEGRSSISVLDLPPGADNLEDIVIQIISTNRNIYGFAKSSNIKIPGTSETVSLSLFKNGQEHHLESLHTTVVLKLDKNSEFIPPPFTSGVLNESNPRLPEALIAVDGSHVYQPLVMLEYRIDQEDVSFHLQLQPQNMDARPQYLLLARHIFPPNLNEDDESGATFWAVIPPSTKFYDDLGATADEKERNMTFFVSNAAFAAGKRSSLMASRGLRLTAQQLNTLYVGYRQLSAIEVDTYGPEAPPPKPYPFEDQINVTVHLRGYFSSCNSMSGSSSSWSSYGCNVSIESTVKETVCICNHLTTFAAGWLVVPNGVDFDYIFRNIDFEKNPTLYATELTIAIGITPLPENNPADEYLYEVLVGTGLRRSAGTTSTVCFQLSGERGGTGTCTLRDPHRRVLKAGNVDRFLLAVAEPLGDLHFLRLWHNNSGAGDDASWFCDFVVVIDLQTTYKYYFIVGKWFAVDEDDGLVDRVIPVVGSQERLQFSYLFNSKVKLDVSDGHLWISVFTRPVHSRFTRVERVACCLLILFLNMVSSCMFYRNEGPVVKDALFTIGPFALTPSVVGPPSSA